MNTAELYNSIAAEGVHLYIEDGQLRARGGDFTPELRKAAGKAKADLMAFVASTRVTELMDGIALWSSFTTPEKGFFIGVVRDAVTNVALVKFERAKANFIAGTGELVEVHAAFTNYAKASRIRTVNRQLGGSIYEPSWGGKRKSQAEIHLAFKNMEATQNEDQIKRYFRSSVTPQVEPQPDQLFRMGIYFGVKADDYIAARFDKSRR